MDGRLVNWTSGQSECPCTWQYSAVQCNAGVSAVQCSAVQWRDTCFHSPASVTLSSKPPHPAAPLWASSRGTACTTRHSCSLGARGRLQVRVTHGGQSALDIADCTELRNSAGLLFLSFPGHSVIGQCTQQAGLRSAYRQWKITPTRRGKAVSILSMSCRSLTVRV
jgi:hypothetical protein